MSLQQAAIRSLQPSDGEDLRRLYLRSLRNNPHGFVQDTLYHGDILDRALILQKNRGDMLGLFGPADRGLLGFGGLKRQKEPGHVELCNLHVCPQNLRKGHGRTLTSALLARASELNYRVVTLQVAVTQAAALGLYTALGFQKTTRQVLVVGSQSFDMQFMALGFDEAG